MPEPVKIRISRNFEHNLKSIECYYQEYRSKDQYQFLLDKLFDVIIPNIESHPKIGFDFLAQAVNSVEEFRRIEIIKKGLSLNSSIRQYNDHEYIVLYHLDNLNVTLLAIKHQKQMTFDLKSV